MCDSQPSPLSSTALPNSLSISSNSSISSAAIKDNTLADFSVALLILVSFLNTDIGPDIDLDLVRSPEVAHDLLLFSGGLRNSLDIREIGANSDNMEDSYDSDIDA